MNFLRETRHEFLITPDDLVKKQSWTPGAALNVGTQVHTSPAQFGKVMSLIKPRMAVGYHFFNDFDKLPNVLEAVRSTYDGPLALWRSPRALWCLKSQRL